MSLILTAADIALLRTVGVTALPDTATLSRSTQTTDAAGGITNTWATLGSYACSIAPYLGRKGADEVVQQERFAALQYWRILLPAGTPVTLKDRLSVNSRTYEVKGVGAGQSTWEVLVAVFCVEVT